MTYDIKGPVKDATGTAKSSIDSAAEQFQDVADQATRQLSDIGGNAHKAIDKSLTEQPYTTLALAAVAGLVIGAIWKS